MKKIGFIGMGNMASAIAGGIIKSNFIEGNRVYAFDIDQEKLMKMNHEFNLISCESEIDLVEKVDLVVLAIKPNIVDEVIVKIKDKLDDKAVISIIITFYTTFISYAKYTSFSIKRNDFIRKGKLFNCNRVGIYSRDVFKYWRSFNTA